MTSGEEKWTGWDMEMVVNEKKNNKGLNISQLTARLMQGADSVADRRRTFPNKVE